MNVVQLISKKRDGGELTEDEIGSLIAGYVRGDVGVIEVDELSAQRPRKFSTPQAMTGVVILVDASRIVEYGEQPDDFLVNSAGFRKAHAVLVDACPVSDTVVSPQWESVAVEDLGQDRREVMHACALAAF